MKNGKKEVAKDNNTNENITAIPESKPSNKLIPKKVSVKPSKITEEKIIQVEKPKASIEVKSEEIKKQDKKEGIKDINEFMAKKNEMKKYENILIFRKNAVVEIVSAQQPNKKLIIKDKPNHLKDFIKKMREKKPKDTDITEVLWMKGMQELSEKKPEKELKFPDVIVFDDPKQFKKQEEFIQANKMLLELDKINNDSETIEEEQIQVNQNDINESIRDYNEITVYVD